MAGIYIHIPFCKKACHYCDFHFSLNTKTRKDVLKAIKKEIELRCDYLEGKTIETVYFGGGTPSVLEPSEINGIMECISKFHNIEHDAEISLEANPDDLTKQKIHDFKNTPVNRLSIGIQSFFDEDLVWMNRSHSSEQARQSILEAQNADFTNISADLIYGYPLLTDNKFRKNISDLLDMRISHLSAYIITVEKKTALAHYISKGKESLMDEDTAARQFLLLGNEVSKRGFMHYEISNFAKEGFISKHNSAYWTGKKYLGIGPSSHSYNSVCRHRNVSNNYKYINYLSQGRLPVDDEEKLDDIQRMNEYIMLSVRTIWGINLDKLNREFGAFNAAEIKRKATKFIREGYSAKKENSIVLTEKGMIYADMISRELFI